MTQQIRERPIIFSMPMVRAILDGRKTQTRRVVKPKPFERQPAHDMETTWMWSYDAFGRGDPYACVKFACLKGDVLWVRETWCPDLDGKPHYRADETDYEAELTRWRPSIHMPRWAARLFLRVTAVRVEHLQEIRDAEFKAEGISMRDYQGHGPAAVQWMQGEFVKLWDSLNAHRGYGWDANPWVWVIEFERIGSYEAAA